MHSMRAPAYARCLLIVAVAAAGWAQPSQQAEAREFGSVIGHIYCADTNAPARFARVTIEPIEDFKRVNLDAKPSAAPRHVPSTTMMETKPDGSFAIEYVIPGTYYILVELPGYQHLRWKIRDDICAGGQLHIKDFFSSGFGIRDGIQ
jgi:hypothetical protein